MSRQDLDGILEDYRGVLPWIAGCNFRSLSRILEDLVRSRRILKVFVGFYLSRIL